MDVLLWLLYSSYLVDVHLTVPVNVRLFYEQVDLGVSKLRTQLSHDVSELLCVDRPRPVLVEKLLLHFPSIIFVLMFFHRDNDQAHGKPRVFTQALKNIQEWMEKVMHRTAKHTQPTRPGGVLTKRQALLIS